MYHPVRGFIIAEHGAQAAESLEIASRRKTVPLSVANCHIYAETYIYFLFLLSHWNGVAYSLLEQNTTTKCVIWCNNGNPRSSGRL